MLDEHVNRGHFVTQLVHMTPGESLVKVRTGRLNKRFFIGFEALDEIASHAPASVLRLILWAATRLVLDTNMVGQRTIGHHAPHAPLATKETLAADLERSKSSLRRDLDAADQLDVWACITVRNTNQTHFLMNPRLVWRGNPAVREAVINYYAEVRSGQQHATVNDTTSLVTHLRQK